MEKPVFIKRVLISVSNKTGIKSFAKFLAMQGAEIIATTGTAKYLGGDIAITPIEQITGNPEAFSARMKTISFQILSSLLYRRDLLKDREEAKSLAIEAIDLLICNLYPFEKAKEDKVSDEALLEKIDIGGPTMIRAAAKNFISVAVLSDPKTYPSFMKEMEENKGSISLETRKILAVEAFQLMARYEMMIAQELTSRFTREKIEYLELVKGKKLRYGENPHQSAYHYRYGSWQKEYSSVTSATIIQGKALSYNNILDADAAYRIANDALRANSFEAQAVAVVKHNNPSGLALAPSSLEALDLAWKGDSLSSFGSVICFTGEVDDSTAAYLQDKFVEIIIASSLTPQALHIFAQKKNMRILLCSPKKKLTAERMFRSISGAMLVQDEDEGLDEHWKCVTKIDFPSSKNKLVHFGIMAVKHLKSNSIAIVVEHKQGRLQLFAAGMGQPNRLDSIRMLVKARILKKDSLAEELVLVSDAFFPFVDSIDAAHELGIRFIVQPGGSIRDQEIIDACDRYGMAMLFTGRRHFRH